MTLTKIEQFDEYSFEFDKTCYDIHHLINLIYHQSVKVQYSAITNQYYIGEPLPDIKYFTYFFRINNVEHFLNILKEKAKHKIDTTFNLEKDDSFIDNLLKDKTFNDARKIKLSEKRTKRTSSCYWGLNTNNNPETYLN